MIAFVLIGIFATVAAVSLPVGGSSLPSMDDTVAGSGSGAGALSTAVSASTTAPLEDGTVAADYTPDPNATKITTVEEFNSYRNNDNVSEDTNIYLDPASFPDGITLDYLTDHGIFKGTLDGCGVTIYIDATTTSSWADANIGGLFSQLAGTVKNLNIVVKKFVANLPEGSAWSNAGMVAGYATKGAVVSNVKVTLNYSPTTKTAGSSDFYLNQIGQSGGTESNNVFSNVMKLGGIFGCVAGGTATIVNTTVDNKTAGDYGFSMFSYSKPGYTSGIFNTTKHHSQSYVYLGGFVGCSESNGVINMNNITLSGSSTAKFFVYCADKETYRQNYGRVGGIIGYQESGSATIDGLIISCPIVLDSDSSDYNVICSDTNKSNMSDAANGGVIVGALNGTTVSISKAYFAQGVATDWLEGGNNSSLGKLSTYSNTTTPRFTEDGTGISFGCYTKQDPNNASAIVSTISTAENVTESVLELFIAENPSEVGKQAWLQLPITDGGQTINLADSYASNGSFFFDRDLVITEDTGTAYKSAQDYNGANIVSPKLLLKDKDGGAAGSIDGVYVEANPYATVGEHTLAYTQSAIESAGYTVVDYDGVSYIVSVEGGYIYTPDNVTVAESETTFKLKNDQVIEIVPLEVTIGFGCEDIIYKDTAETVKSKITVNVVNKPTFMGDITAFGVTLTTADGEYTASTPAGTDVTIALIEDQIEITDGEENYDIVFQTESIQKTVQKLVLSGSFSGLDSLVYNAQSQKTAVFTVDGLGAEEITYKYTAKEGIDEIDVVNAGEYTVTATATDPSIELSGNSTDFTVTPKEVAIVPQDKEATYGGLAFTEYESLFTAPEGLGSDGTLAISASVAEGVEIKNVGKYTVTATLADASGNYTAEQVTATYTVTKATVKITLNEEATTSKVYDGTALSRDDMAALFNVTGAVAGTPAVLDVTVNDDAGEVKNAGKYNLIAGLDGQSSEFYEISSDSVTETVYTIDKIDVEITETNYIGQSFNNEIFTDYGSLFNAPVGIDGITPLELAYSVTLNGEAATIFNCGNYIVTATLAENDVNVNYNAVPLQRQYYVEAWEVEVVWGENDYTYNGDVQSVTAKYIDWNDTEKYLAVSFGEGVEFRNAGEYTATASFAEGDNEYGNYALKSETKTNVYNINKADSVINTDDVETVYTYTGALQTVTGAKLNHGEAELVYANNTFTTVAEGNGMLVEISVGASANYYAASTTVQITVNKATPEVTATVEPTEGLFTSSEMPAISADCAVEGTIAWETDELTAGAKEYAWTFTPSDTANYNVVTGKTTLTVSAVELVGIEVVSQPSKLDYQYGDTFVSDGMVVEAVYNDGSREVIGDYTVTDGYLTSLGANQITVTYKEKTATVTVNVGARVFELAYNDLTVVAGTQDFDLTTDVTATIAGTVNNTVSLAGTDYSYVLTIAYADNAYSSDDPVGTTYALDVTLVLEGLDAQYYIGEYTAILRVIATSMEGSWVSETVTAEYDGNTHAAEFNKTIGGDFEIQYAVKGTDVWTTDVPVNAGEYVAKVVSLNDGYSADRLPTATVTINKKVVTISANGVENGVYSGAEVDPATMFTSPQGVGDDVLTLEYTITKGDAPIDEIKDAGIYKVVARLVDESGNYTATACETTYTVAPAEVSVNWTGSSSVVYSGEAYEPTFEATGLVGDDQLTVTYQAKDGLALTGDKARNAGSYTAIVSLSSDNYVFAAETSTIFDFTVEKVKVSYSTLLDGNTKYVEYGGDYVPSVDDFYSTSVENSNKFEFYIRWSLEFDLSGITTANAGTKYEAAVEGVVRYAGGADISEEDYANFELIGDVVDTVVYVEITAKQLTITATDGNATYDGEKVGVEELLAMFGLGGIDVKFTVDDEDYDYADIKNVGVYTVKIASANENYKFIGDTDATFTVNAADMTSVTVTGYSGEYDKAAHGAVVNASATTVDGIEATFTYATSEDGVYGTAPEYTDAGTYTVYYKAVAANHNEVTGSFTVTISKAVVDLPEIESKPYNGEIQTATIAESTIYSVTKNEGGINAGDYEVTIVLADTANYAWAGSDEDNDGSVTLTFTVTKVANAWTTEPAIDGWTYGAAANEPEGDALYGNVSFSYQTASGEPLGAKPVNAGSYILVATVDGNTNYEGLSMTVEFALAKADYDMSGVVFENASKVYNGETQSITVDGELPDGVTVSYSEGIRNAGSRVITATFTSTDANYNVPDTMTATLTVTAKELTVENVTALNRVYDGTTAVEVTGSLAGVIGSDDVTLEISGTMADKNVGENKNVTVAANISGADSGNYTIADVDDVIVTVTAKEITVVWSNTSLTYNGESQAPTAAADTGIEGESVTLEVSGAAVEVGKHTATATVSEPDGNYVLTNATVEYEIVRKDIIAQFTVGYGTIGVSADGGTQGIEYRVDGGAWTVLPENGVINVDLEASWTIALRYEGDTQSVSHVIYTSSANVVTYLNENLSDNAIENKEIIATAETWLATAVGDKTEANEKVEQAKAAYETALGLLEDSVENALKATANLTSRAVAATVAVAAVSVFGLAVGAVALRRKGGKKNENK